MKVTACEAEDIRPLAVNSPLMDRGYGVMSVGQFTVPLRASVRHTSARTAIPPICCGHIGQRKRRRRVGPTQVARITLVTSVDQPAARNDQAHRPWSPVLPRSRA
jgi:hypothetical protein